MKDLVIIGAGDFSRETVWIAERMNMKRPQWNILGFVDDGNVAPEVDGYPVLGTTEWLKEHTDEVYVTCGIGNGSIRRKIWNRLADCSHIRFATLIDPTATIGKDCEIGEGSIVCAGSVLSINTKLGFNTIVNLNCTIGHDAVLEECCTVHPGANISGRVTVHACTDIGTGTRIIQGKTIGGNAIIGAGAVIIRDMPGDCTIVGCPAEPIKYR